MGVKNKERRSANISLFIMLVALIVAFAPIITKADMMDWGFAATTFGGIIALISLIVFIMYNGRAKVFSRMFTGENILAHWQYSREFWQAISKEDMESSGIGKIAGFFLGGIFLLIGIIVFAADTDENKGFFLLMLCIAVFFVIIGFVSSAMEKKRIRDSLPIALIAKEGVFYKNILYTWNTPAISYLESVTFHPVQPSTLLFVLRQLSGRIAHYHRFNISIPIPPGEEYSVNNIVSFFNLPMSEDQWAIMQNTNNE